MNFPSVTREISSFHAAALILGGAALVSKLLGLLRDRLLASRFGAGVELDVYYAAFQIPDVLYTIFLIGAAAAAVLPVFMEYERRSAGESEAFVSNLLTVFSIAGSVLVAVAINGIFVAVGAILFLVGLSMAIRLFRSYFGSREEVRARAPTAPGNGGR